MIPADHALRCCLALKLWSIERKSHVMALVADEGLALFAGLNAFPKKSYLSEYSCRIEHRKTTGFLAAWHHAVQGSKLLPGESFNLDFHSVPYYGEDPLIERHYVSMRSRASPASWSFWPRMPAATSSATPMPICAKARKPRRFSSSSLSGSALTASCPAIWCSIPN